MKENEFITKMIEAIMKVAKGDYSAQIELSGKNDELDSLGIGLNMMIDDIRVNYQELKNMQVATLNILEDLDRRSKELDVINKQFKLEINERKRAEEALNESKKNLAERVKELNCLYGIANLIEDPNNSLEDILQYSVELISTAWQYPDITCARITLDNKKYSTNNFEETKWKQTSDITINDKKIGTVEVYYKEKRKLLDEGPFLKEERELINAITDQLKGIIHRKTTEEKLADSEEKFRTISSAAQDAIIMIDNDEKITYWNNAAEKIFGYSLKEILGKQLHNILTNEKYQKVVKKRFIEFQKTSKGATVGKTVELVGIKKDGSKFPIEISLSAVKIKGKWNAIGIVRDISERKKMEKELKKYTMTLEEEVKQRTNELLQSEKMSALGQLVAGVAHEINNPLAYLKSNSEFLGEFFTEMEDKFKGNDLEIYNEMKQLIDSNIEGTNRIATITKTLKRFAKPDQEEKTESDINQGLKDTLIIVHNHLKHRIEVHEELGEIPNVKCNIGQINQVFMNLIMNSSQAMESGDIWIKTWNEENRINVEIKDNGSGIPEEALNRIFDPFYTTKPEGTGLGLSLVYKIIQNHNGILNVNSKIGEGTTMRISLPMEE